MVMLLSILVVLRRPLIRPAGTFSPDGGEGGACGVSTRALTRTNSVFEGGARPPSGPTRALEMDPPFGSSHALVFGAGRAELRPGRARSPRNQGNNAYV